MAFDRTAKVLVAINASDGQERWRYVWPSGEENRDRYWFHLSGERVLLWRDQRTVIGLRAGDGAELWKMKTDCLPWQMRAHGALAIGVCQKREGSSQRGFIDKELFLSAIDLDTGTELWRTRWARRPGHDFNGVGVDTDGKMVVLEPRAGAGKTRIEALEGRSGRRLWSRPVPLPAVWNIAMVGSSILVSGIDLLAFDRESGLPQWSINTRGESGTGGTGLRFHMQTPNDHPWFYQGGIVGLLQDGVVTLDFTTGQKRSLLSLQSPWFFLLPSG